MSNDELTNKGLSNADKAAEYDAIQKTLKRERKARKLAEEMLEQRATELYLANIELDNTIATLKRSNLQLLQSEKMASVGQLAAGVAHEINNPIGFISSNLGTLREYIDDLRKVVELQQRFISASEDNEQPPGSTLPRKAEEKQQLQAQLNAVLQKADLEFMLPDPNDLLDESIDGVKRIRKIVADLSDFSRVNTPDYKEADINELIEKTINVAWNEMKYKVEIVRDFGTLPAVRCNSGKLAQVFLNLLINASHAIEGQGTVTLRTESINERVEISIIDTGSGISEEKLVSIFDPFFTTKAPGKGTGLGLHIARSVIDAHQGVIEVESEEGKGTCFTVSLLVAGPKLDEDQQNTPS